MSDYTEDLNDPVIQRTTGRVDGSINLELLPRLSLGLAAARTEYTSGRVREEINQRTTSNLFGVASLNHNATFTRTRYAALGLDTEQTLGSVLLNIPAFGAFLRGGTTYSMTSDITVESAALAIDYNLSEDVFARGEVFRQMNGEKLNSAVGSLTQQFEHFAIGVSAGADDAGNVMAGISLNFAVGQEPLTGNMRFYGEPVSNHGLVNARSYLDANHNQTYDDGEETLPNSTYLVNGGTGSRRMHDYVEDMTFVKYLPTYEPTIMTINPSSLDDPFLIAGDSGVRVVARPGVPVVLNFALEKASDVEGLVLISRGGEIKEAANVLIEAVNNKGEVVRSARTAFDGVYLLELVPAGDYIIRVSQAQSKRLGFKNTTTQTLTIQGGEEYIQDVNLHIKQ